jgi:hypothetical protein
VAHPKRRNGNVAHEKITRYRLNFYLGGELCQHGRVAAFVAVHLSSGVAAAKAFYAAGVVVVRVRD